MRWGMSKALHFLQITAKGHNHISYDKNFVPKYLNNALTELA